MGNNPNPKKRGLAHYLYEQWKATKIGKEEHKKLIEKQQRQKAKLVKFKSTKLESLSKEEK